MATITITTENDLESNYSPNPGDQYNLTGLSSLIFDRSTVQLQEANCGSPFRKLIFRNTSTTQINICRINDFLCNASTIELDGLLIDAGTLTGTPSETLTIPSDAAGDYPPVLGYGYISGVLYTQVTSFADMYSDLRGRHFIYDNLTGQVTFGDGTNGDTPTGTFQIPNIFIVTDRMYLFDGVISGEGHCVFIDMRVQFGFSCNVDSDWGIVNAPSEVVFDADKKHKYGNLNFIGVGAGLDARMNLSEDTVGDQITFQTERSSSNGVKSAIAPFYGSHEFRMIAQSVSTFSNRIRLSNNGGDAELRIYQGGSPSFRPDVGVGGKFDITVSDRYLRTDTPTPALMYNNGQNCDIELFFRPYGDFTYVTQGIALFFANSGRYKIGSASEKMVFPSTMVLNDIFRFEGVSSGSIDNVRYEGISNSGDADYNINAPKGFIVSNIEVPNDTDHGCTPDKNTEYQFVSMINRNPRFSSGMASSIIVKNAARTQGQIWLHPSIEAPNGELVSGDIDDIIYNGDSVYFANIGNKTRTRSRMLNGVENVASVVITGDSTGNFAYTYKIWEATSPEPATYKTLNTANVQADTSAFTTDTYWFIEYEVEKTAGAADQGRIRGIYIDVDLEPNYLWQDIQNMEITFTGLEVDDYYYISDSSGNTVVYGQATSPSETVSILGINDGQTYSFAADKEGKVADVGTFTVVAGGSLIIPIVMPELRRTDGQPMYTGTSDSAISVDYNFIAPEASIGIGNKTVEAQTIFDVVEKSLITEEGMRWHTVYGTIVKFNKVAASGDILNMEDYWRLRRASAGDINAGVNGYVESTQGIVVDDLNGDVKYSPAGISAQMTDIYDRFDLNVNIPNTYEYDNTGIENDRFSLDATDNGDGTFTVARTDK